MSFHNLCQELTLPPGIGTVLGLGAKFCIEEGLPPKDHAIGIHRLLRNFRIKHFIQGTDDTKEDSYNAKLYTPSKRKFNQPIPDGNIEMAVLDFSDQLERITKQQQSLPKAYNLNPQQYSAIHTLRNDPRFVICQTDKNLGIAIIERKTYIELAFRDHLSNQKFYKLFDCPGQATLFTLETRKLINQTFAQHKSKLAKNEVTFFERSLKDTCRLPLLHLLPKVHKTPMKTRPIVSCVGSRLECPSKWLSSKMKILIPIFSDTYIPDSYAVVDDLKAIGTLKSTTKFFTSDAVAMYTNINTDHALDTFQKALYKYKSLLPPDFPTEMFLQMLRLVMTRNVFQFDDQFWLQISGTAMGTSTAKAYADLYFAIWEREHILTSFRQNLIYYKRFVDDVLGIWNGTCPQQWSAFKKAMNSFGPLPLIWETSPLVDTVTFLDLEIWKDPKSNAICTKTFQKPMNLFLYIPANSAHSPGVLKSIIYGNLRRYWYQNTNTADYIQVSAQFANNLKARGHDPATIKTLFLEAASMLDRIASPSFVPVRTDTRKNSAIFHMDYHPRGVTRREIQRLYKNTCGKPASRLGFDRLTIAHHRPRNIRDALMRTRLPVVAGIRASNIWSKIAPRTRTSAEV